MTTKIGILLLSITKSSRNHDRKHHSRNLFGKTKGTRMNDVNVESYNRASDSTLNKTSLRVVSDIVTDESGSSKHIMFMSSLLFTIGFSV